MKHALEAVIVPAARSWLNVQVRKTVFRVQTSSLSSLVHVFCMILVRCRACSSVFHLCIHRLCHSAIRCLPLFAAYMHIESALSVGRLVRFFGLLLLVLLIRDRARHYIRQKFEILHACYRIGWNKISNV